jgi:anti-sigma-K factor RskA
MNQSKKASNRLERFVRDHRDEFENLEPSLDLWEKLEAKLPKLPNDTALVQPVEKNAIIPFFPKIQRYWRVAASVAVIIGALGLWYANQSSSNSDIIVSQVGDQYKQQMVHYASLIETKRDEIRQIADNEPALYQEFSSEIERLNKDYQSLRAELPQTPNQEELVKAMIQNLQLQLDILNQQLSIIQRVKEAKQGHGKSMQTI